MKSRLIPQDIERVSGWGQLFISNLDILWNDIRRGVTLEDSVMTLSLINPGVIFAIRNDIRPDGVFITWSPDDRPRNACPTCGCLSC